MAYITLKLNKNDIHLNNIITEYIIEFGNNSDSIYMFKYDDISENITTYCVYSMTDDESEMIALMYAELQFKIYVHEKLNEPI